MAQKKPKQVVPKKTAISPSPKVVKPIKDIFSWAFQSEFPTAASEDISKKIFWYTMALVSIVYVFISKDFGISWDENGHWRIGNANLDYFLSFGKDKTCLDETKHLFSSLLYYGESFNTFTALIIRWFPSFGAFEVRHFFNALTGVIGILFTGLLAKESGSWKSGIIAMVIMALTPAYLGHSMNNPTDIPFATGFVASVYFLIRLLKTAPKLNLIQSLYVGLAIGMSMSIRVGALMLFAYVGLFMGISFLYQLVIKRVKFGELFVDYAKSFSIIVLVGYALGIAFWPYALQAPFKNPFLALSHSTDPKFFVISYELFEGKKIYMGDAPWYYVIKFMTITIPLVFLIGVLFFSGLYYKMVSKVQSWILIACVFVFVFPILTALYKDLMVYNAWRHYLFVFPFFAVISANGWVFLEQIVHNKFFKIGIWGMLGILSIQLVYWNIQNHPQQYVYYNELVGGVKGAYGNYETDYYSNSVRAATEWLIDNEKLKNKKVIISTNNEVLTSQYYAQRLADSVQVKWQREGEGSVVNWDYEIITSRTFDPIQFKNGGFPPKGTIHTIDCDGVALAAIVKKENNLKFLGNQFSLKQQLDSAVKYLEKYAEYDPNDEEVFRLLAVNYTNLGKFDLAMKFVEKAIALKPSNSVPYSLKGIIFANTGKVDQAIDLFKKSVSLRINYTDGYVYMANAYLQKKDFYMAASIYEKALSMTPPNPDLMNQAGVAYLNAGNYDRALAYFMTIIREFPNYPYAYQNAAYIYFKQGNSVEANRYMQAAQQLGAR